MNKVILMGRMVADPETRYTQSNVPVTRFRLAVNKPRKPQEGQPSAEFFKIVAWRGTALFVERYLKKGMQVLVEGHLKTNIWDDHGTKRYEEYTQADHVYFADSKKLEQPVNGNHSNTTIPQDSLMGPDECYYTLNEDDEDLPF